MIAIVGRIAIHSPATFRVSTRVLTRDRSDHITHTDSFTGHNIAGEVQYHCILIIHCSDDCILSFHGDIYIYIHIELNPPVN